MASRVVANSPDLLTAQPFVAASEGERSLRFIFKDFLSVETFAVTAGLEALKLAVFFCRHSALHRAIRCVHSSMGIA